ncbi:MAG TPA: oligopeptide/dipeptide ABC transporter ATP-binding protein [Patescibacteria group bacterium]|nr:oligopeptide/dipeptide ABC transporter ATP-binding protein [Patescibacteria group bacterium]
MTAVLQLEDVHKTFVVKSFWGKESVTRAVDGVDLSVNRGETLGIVGESGCGKSTLANLLTRLEKPDTGKILLDGVDIAGMNEAQLRPLRSRIQMVFQDSHSSLDPRFTVRQILEEPMRVSRRWNQEKMTEKIRMLMEKVGLSADQLPRYPHEFSGGQRQRLAIARALTTNPEVLILDEPTSALDVSVQAQVLNLLLTLQAELGLTYIFISHNLAVVRYIARRVAVMYFGKIVELGDTGQVLAQPMHPYTRELIDAVPAIGKPLREENRDEGSGEKTSAMTGCPHSPRCPLAQPRCRQTMPHLREIQSGQRAACWAVE